MLDNTLNTFAILGWIVFVLFLLLVALRGFQLGGARGAGRAVFRPRVLLVFLIILGITLLSTSLVFIEPQEVGVVISLVSRDGYRDEPMRSGLHWIVPLAERVVRYPISWQTYTMSSDPLEGIKVGHDSIAARTSDGQSVFLDASVIFRIDGNEAIRVHIDLQDRYIEDFIRPLMRGLLRSEVSQFTVDEVNSSKRISLESNLQDLLELAFRDKGFILDRFLLRNIGFSTEYATAVEAKQVAEQTRIEREFQAEQIRNLAEGQRDKFKIEAEGQAEAILLQGQAEAQVILLKAQAEAEGLRLINEILQENSNLLTYHYVDKLGPGIQVMLVPNDNPFLLPIPDLTDNLSGGTLLDLTPGPDASPAPAGSPTPTPTELP